MDGSDKTALDHLRADLSRVDLRGTDAVLKECDCRGQPRKGPNCGGPTRQAKLARSRPPGDPTAGGPTLSCRPAGGPSRGRPTAARQSPRGPTAGGPPSSGPTAGRQARRCPDCRALGSSRPNCRRPSSAVPNCRVPCSSGPISAKRSLSCATFERCGGHRGRRAGTGARCCGPHRCGFPRRRPQQRSALDRHRAPRRDAGRGGAHERQAARGHQPVSTSSSTSKRPRGMRPPCSSVCWPPPSTPG